LEGWVLDVVGLEDLIWSLERNIWMRRLEGDVEGMEIRLRLSFALAGDLETDMDLIIEDRQQSRWPLS
jgi:hypothetical protein